MLSLVNDILDYSQIKAGKFELNLSNFNVRDLVDEVYRMFEYQASEKEIFLLKNIDNDVPIKIVNDHRRLKQVLINLLSNANKFTTEGSISIRV